MTSWSLRPPFWENRSFGCMEEERARGRSGCPSAAQDSGHDSLPGLPSSGLSTIMVSLLLLLLLPLPAQPQLEDLCQWRVVLNKYEALGEGSERFFDQEPVSAIDAFFNKLEDSPIDQKENSEAFVRGGHLKGLIPIVLVKFQNRVNFREGRSERLEIQMSGAPFQTHTESCGKEDICIPSWYTPMPMKNGSVVMEVEISSNNHGELIGDARYMININGFLKKDKDKLIFTLGSEVMAMTHRHFINAPSRPVWATVDQAPVLILGGIPEEKMILISDSSFREISLVELNIDSCWLGSLQCPQEHFTASIFDTISTESVLFIRQNQLVYYFTGNYSHFPQKATRNWIQVLHKRCIKKLCPVELHGNGSEHILALAGGNEEGFFYLGTIKDATVTFKQLPLSSSICATFQDPKCSLHWVIYDVHEDIFLLLMELGKEGHTTFSIVQYVLVSNDYHHDSVQLLYKIPRFIPEGKKASFVMLLGMEEYTDSLLVPKGLHYNPFSNLLYIWGNAILQSYDNKNYIYLDDFPKESSVKYMASSYKGEVICVTENEEIWFIVEGSFKVHRLYPSDGWQMLFTLSQMQASSLYSTNETSVSIFYDNMGPQQLVYLINKKGEGKLVTRPLPVSQILVYQLLSLTTYKISTELPLETLSYNNPCPFEVLQLRDLPNPQRYTRVERYRALPPFVSSDAGFHTKVSLAIYQGLVYHLLWLHSKYNKAYADPVHDPTWRWWKDKKKHKDFFFYKASNFESMYGVHIEMDGYEKLYKLNAQNRLPEYIYLDKGATYSFSIYLVSPKISYTIGKQKRHLRLAVIMADPMCVSATVKEQALVNRNAMLFQVSVKDKSQCFKQSISGHNLRKTALHIKVVGSVGKCFVRTRYGHLMQGTHMIRIYIGCPPRKRLAFDFTMTVEQNRRINKRYFDCVHKEDEMPCFLFSDSFFPFFLIQDMVTGESGSFNGSYVLKVIGGGTSKHNIVDYSEADIYRYNSPKDNTDSLIWTVRDNWMDHHSFSILQHNKTGIEWLCLKNSPCHDVVPHSFYSPEFFFKIMVSNRDVDTSSYCDYQLTFLLHVHGLPLSPQRALFFLWVTLFAALSFVFFYLFSCFLWPRLKSCWIFIKMKFTDLITEESFYTYTTSATSVPSMVSSRLSAGERTSVRSRSKKKI
uniref:Cation channel sperm-associated protein subunit gamma isoform X3 n=1 Tax=Phascolarctos cinereus TaxID=38626 RepID=A0A6P5JSI2_PHACI|nr:cation channel sperm-associated protein subunit gamma isoform X3 [Phascolarctos cinereus]